MAIPPHDNSFIAMTKSNKKRQSPTIKITNGKKEQKRAQKKKLFPKRELVWSHVGIRTQIYSSI